MRYFVYFFRISVRTHSSTEYVDAHSAIADTSVPSVKKLTAMIKMAHQNAWYVGCTGFHEFANEKDYKDFCG